MKFFDFEALSAYGFRFFENRGLKGGAEPTVCARNFSGIWDTLLWTSPCTSKCFKIEKCHLGLTVYDERFWVDNLVFPEIDLLDEILTSELFIAGCLARVFDNKL